MVLLTTIFIGLLQNTLSANVLYIAPVASPSHHIWNRVLALELVRKGYNVTMIGHDVEKEIRNFTFILLEGVYEGASLDLNDVIHQTPLRNIKEMYEWGSYVCEHDLNTEGLKILLNYSEDFKFDVLIFDITLGQCLYPLIEKFGNPPIVGVTPFLLPPVLSTCFGNHLFPSYMPYYNSDFTKGMSFIERMFNFIYTNSELVYRTYVHMIRETELAKSKFGNDIRSLEETERKISILLSNIDPVLDYPIVMPPNIIPVGGLHVKAAKELPSELEKILDSPKEGIVLFSLGTNVKSEQLSQEVKKTILKTFEMFPQTFLWKFEADDLEGLPDNVVIRKWLPQNDILGHKNTKLFISHGGALGTQEAMYHGVPVLGLPLFSDQKANIAKMVERKLAKSLDIRNIQFQTFYESLKEMLDNSIYYENAKKMSKRYRDQSETSLNRAVFWVEYIIRHGNAEHLSPHSRDMPWYQIANLDVLLVLCLGIILLYSLLTFFVTGLRFLYGRLFKSFLS